MAKSTGNPTEGLNDSIEAVATMEVVLIVRTIENSATKGESLLNKKTEELAAAMLEFIMTHPPKGFNLPYFQICLMSGRFEELITILKEFKEPECK